MQHYLYTQRFSLQVYSDKIRQIVNLNKDKPLYLQTYTHIHPFIHCAHVFWLSQWCTWSNNNSNSSSSSSNIASQRDSYNLVLEDAVGDSTTHLYSFSLSLCISQQKQQLGACRKSNVLITVTCVSFCLKITHSHNFGFWGVFHVCVYTDTEWVYWRRVWETQKGFSCSKVIKMWKLCACHTYTPLYFFFVSLLLSHLTAMRCWCCLLAFCVSVIHHSLYVHGSKLLLLLLNNFFLFLGEKWRKCFTNSTKSFHGMCCTQY